MASTRNRNGYSYIYGNLDHTSTTKSWSPYYTNGNQYLEFRLSEPYYVTGFDTKGDTYSNSWVTKIKFLFYNDTSAMWVCKFDCFEYQEKNRFEMILKEISVIAKFRWDLSWNVACWPYHSLLLIYQAYSVNPTFISDNFILEYILLSSDLITFWGISIQTNRKE